MAHRKGLMLPFTEQRGLRLLAGLNRVAAIVVVALLGLCAPLHAFSPESFVLAGNNVEGEYSSVHFVNDSVGAMIFYDAGFFGGGSVIANVEGGHVWGGHEVFARSELDPSLPASPSLLVNATPDAETAPHLGELDYHATMVGHVLAGTGHDQTTEGSLTFLGMGMAPFAELWSGAVATEFDSEDIGSFSISAESVRVPYETFFTGGPGQKPDVINSSWGYSSDTEGSSATVRMVDALANENPGVTFVTSAGNSGPDPGTVGAFGTGYNGITVASLGGIDGEPRYTEPSDFSSSGPADFHNPETGITEIGARAPVHLAAPGEQMALAYYGGATGSLRGEVEPEDPLPDDLYFVFSASGTSFSAPLVAGGVALLKDLTHSGTYHDGVETARDSRVMRSVLMAGARETAGWDNGQMAVDGVITTTQSLDHRVGAGRMDLSRSAEVYVFGTGDLPGTDGGTIDYTGWDFGSVDVLGENEYVFGLDFPFQVELTVSLNWFVNRIYDPGAGEGNDWSFANLDLQVWSVVDGLFDSMVGQSSSDYNNSEFLRLRLDDPGRYGIRVAFSEVVYDLAEEPEEFLVEEQYGLAWYAAPFAIPEPSGVGLVLIVLPFLWHRLRMRSIRRS